MSNSSLCEMSSKRPELDNYQLPNESLEQTFESEDFSFLDEIDVDELADCLNKCKEDTNQTDTYLNTSVRQTSQNYKENNTLNEHFKPKPNFSYRQGFFKNLEHKMLSYFQDQYIVDAILHNGKYSTIIKCRDSNRKKYVVKMLKSNINQYYGEAKLKMLLQIQSNIAKENLFNVYFKDGFTFQNRWCFLMEYYSTTLKDVMQEFKKPFHIKTVQDLARQLVAAVTLLKYNDIVHSDIKPSHILLDYTNKRLKLSGFDDAYYNGASNKAPNKGTLNYRAPEIILGYSSGFSIDVWATAVVLVEMVTHQTVFPGSSNNAILYKQMCMLGNIPNEMLAHSQFRSHYFDKNMFKKQGALETNIKHDFSETNMLKNMILSAQHEHWIDKYHRKEKETLMHKVESFIALVKQMIVIVPEYRLSINDVYADPFIYEMFDCIYDY